jgi:hypothetical protein
MLTSVIVSTDIISFVMIFEKHAARAAATVKFGACD